MVIGASSRNKKKALEENRTIVCADESAFYLLPFLDHTYAPKGKTPVIRNKLSKEHLSVISAVTTGGKIFTRIFKKSINGKGVVQFLKHLLRHIPGKITLVWDGAMIHKCKAVKEFLATESRGRLHLEMFPPYAPDRNPDEGVWQYLKCVLLKNCCFYDIDELRNALRYAIIKFRLKKDIIRSLFKRSGFV